MAREACAVLAGNVALKNLNILAGVGYVVVVVTDEAGGLQTVYHCILLVELPIEGYCVLVAVPLSIEPYCAYGAVVCQQLGELFVHKVVVLRPIFILFYAADDLASGASQWVVVARPINV